MPDQYHVRLEKESLVFSAAHFITFNGDVCERLHGHNYRVRAEVTGPLDENHYVIDFIALRDTLRQLVDELDHHMLLPTKHPQIRVTPDEREVLVTFADKRWIFPREDCVLLPIENTTAEIASVASWWAVAGDRCKQKQRPVIARESKLRLTKTSASGAFGITHRTVVKVDSTFSFCAADILRHGVSADRMGKVLRRAGGR